MATQYQVNTILTNGAVINSGIINLPDIASSVQTNTEKTLVTNISDNGINMNITTVGLYATPIMNVTYNGNSLMSISQTGGIGQYGVEATVTKNIGPDIYYSSTLDGFDLTLGRIISSQPDNGSIGLQLNGPNHTIGYREYISNNAIDHTITLPNTNGYFAVTNNPNGSLPIATSTNAGLVMPVSKTDDMTQEVGVDAEGKLYTAPGSGGGGGGDYLPLSGGNLSGALAVNANTTDKKAEFIVRDDDINSTVVITTSGTKGKDLGPAIFIGPDTDLKEASIKGFSGIRMDMGNWKLVDYGPQDIKFTYGSGNTLTYSGTGFQINNPVRNANIAFPNTGSGYFTLATTNDIPTFTDNGDGTMTITANGSTYKVAIVTD